MELEKVEAYKDSKGNLYATEEEAKKAILTEFILDGTKDKVTEGGNYMFTPYPRDVAKFVVENLDEIIKMYQPSGEVTREIAYIGDGTFHIATYGSPTLNGLKCPKCGSPLYDSSPNITLTSHPAQKHTHCNNCDYKGYRYV